LGYRRLQQWRGKLERPFRTVNVAVLVCITACAVTFRDVPRSGVNEVHEYLGSAMRAPAELEHLDSIPQLAWTAVVGRGVTGAPAVGERVTAIASVDRWVYAIDTRSGELFWRFRGSDAFGVGPVMGGGAVYVATETGDGVITSIDLHTGKRRWQSRVGTVAAPMVLRDTILYAATRGGVLLALNTRDGRTEWSRVAAQSRAGPLVTRSFVAVPGLIDSLFVFEAGTGRPIARVSIPTAVIAPLAMISDSLIVASSPEGAVFALELPSGEVRWRVDTRESIPGGPVVHGDTVFAITNGCAFWQIPVGAPGDAHSRSLGCRTRTGPAILRDGVLVATVAGDLQFHDRSGRSRHWSLSIGGELLHPPIVQRGQIVIVPVLGDVMSFR
jgi:hypothetical protein